MRCINKIIRDFEFKNPKVLNYKSNLFVSFIPLWDPEIVFHGYFLEVKCKIAITKSL